MRVYKIFRREKGSDNQWKSTTQSNDYEYIMRVFEIHTTDEGLNEFEWKLVTIN